MTGIVLAVVLVLLIVWAVHTQRKLAVMDENINSAMGQIGVQLSSRFDALTALLELAADCAAGETQPLMDTVRARRSAITACSAPEDVLRQEELIDRTLGGITALAGQHPELKSNESFAKRMKAVDCYEKMLRTSALIYNDSVTRLNRELRVFPTSLLGSLFGFRRRGYLEAAEKKADPTRPDTKAC